LTEAKATLHIAFNKSIAGSVKQALRTMGRNDRVSGLCDDLSFGPIDALSSDSRAQWIENVVGFDFTEVVHEAELFWGEAISPGIHVIAWVCFHDAAEYCGFLEFIWRIGRASFSVIDATGIEVTDRLHRKWKPRSLGVVAPEQMLEAGLMELVRPLKSEEVNRYRRLWGQLKAENAPLSIISREGLISAPINHFDHWLIRHATDEWRKGARLVGETLGELFQSEESPHVSDIWLWGRVCTLAEEGVLEINGDSSEMQKAMVRRSIGEQIAPTR
jgi:hypothetical protein